MHRIISPFLASVLICFSTAVASAESSANALPGGKNSVVSVQVLDRDGNEIGGAVGFFAGNDGKIVTDCRIVTRWFRESGGVLYVATEGGRRLPLDELVSSKCEGDLVVFKVASTDFPGVRFSPDSAPRAGDIISILHRSGNDAGVSVVKVTGKGSGLNISPSLPLQYTGSPLLNPRGEVTGVLILRREKGKMRATIAPVAKLGRTFGLPLKKKEEVQFVPESVAPVSPPPETVDFYQYYLKGASLDAAGLYEEAVRLYLKSLGMNPEFVDTHLNLATNLCRLGKYDDAINSYKKVLRLNPTLFSVYSKIGAAHIANGDYVNAVKAFSTGIEGDPRSISAHFGLGLAFLLKGDSGAALRQCGVLEGLDKTKAERLKDMIEWSFP